MLKLRKVRLTDSDFFLKQSILFQQNEKFDFAYKYNSSIPFECYIDLLKRNEDPDLIAVDDVLSSFLLAENDIGEIIGRISIRFELNDFLKKVGGHIGYAILPEYRRQGYGTSILKEGLKFIKVNSKLSAILITCDDTNIASSKIIESNGGVYERLYGGPEVSVPKKRFWINLSK